MADYVFRRREQKYLLNEHQRQVLETAMAEHMCADRYGRSLVRNIYYDTPDYRLIRCSLEKPAYKEKLRLRCYGDPKTDAPAFLELKKKYDGIVYKRRVCLPLEQAVDYMADPGKRLEHSQIGREIDYCKRFYRELRPSISISYDRLAWQAEQDALRITLDWDIRYRIRELDLTLPAGGEALLEEGQSLLEIKTAAAMPLWLARLLSAQQIRQCSFSKYGGAYMLLLQQNRIESRGFYYA